MFIMFFNEINKNVYFKNNIMFDMLIIIIYYIIIFNKWKKTFYKNSKKITIYAKNINIKPKV